jgi:hypothetical protein
VARRAQCAAPLELYLGGQLRGVQPRRQSIEHAHEEIPTPGDYEKDEMGRLREEAEMLQQQLSEVMARLGKLRTS